MATVEDVERLIDRCADNDLGSPVVLFTGSRGWKARAWVDGIVDSVANRGAVLLVGDASDGLDYFVRIRMNQLGKPFLVGAANWKGENAKAGGPIRNALMAKVAGLCIAFWDGESRGTANCIAEAYKRGVPVCVCREDGTWEIREKGREVR